VGRFESRMRGVDLASRDLLGRIPLQRTPPLDPEWLRCEMLERFLVLKHVPLREAGRVLDVGSGGHAISTVPLAFLVGADGWVLALERERWGQFRSIVVASGLEDRVRAVTGDARRMPVREDAVDLAVCLHGVRSLGDDVSAVGVFREMLRVAPRIAVAESLPVARTRAQQAHLAMYDLREEVLVASTGRRDDLRYRPLARLASLVEEAEGALQRTLSLEVGLPHASAYFPRRLVEAMPAGCHREDLLARWDAAHAALLRWREDHPPVGIGIADRRAPSC
jgi:SAM-dependent methyltransferase